MRSRDFSLRPLEMIAIACHDIAALLFQSVDGGLHDGSQVWRRDPSTLGPGDVYVEPRPTVTFLRIMSTMINTPRV